MDTVRKICVAILVGALAACASNPSPSTMAAEKPSLVVMIVVDQLRADLLDRYSDLFTGGFRRLRVEGHNFTNAAHDHAATETAVGHATLSTGVYPNRHGIIANAWYEMQNGQWTFVSNVADPTMKIVAAPGRPGVSPHYLERSGLADWIMAADPRSKIASVSGKDRGAIQSAAHARNAFVYWFDSPSGRYVTSTYYRSTDPDWMVAYNSGPLERHRADSVWALEVPAKYLARANRDSVVQEGDGIHTFFPHRVSESASPGAFWQWWESTPHLDESTIEVAEAMVSSLELGKDDAPDFLNVSLSATDRVGHSYGPLSREQLDNLIRLDRELGRFFDYLDKNVGRGKWAMMLTADHGVLDMPEDLVARGEYSHRLTLSEIAHLDTLRAVALANPEKRTAAVQLKASLKKLPIIADAWTQEELMSATPTDSFAILQKRSLYEGREGNRFSREGVEFRFIPGVLGSARGTSHGQTYWYDRHVPMIFMGPGFRAGRDASRAATVDFAPTMARMLGIAFPADLDGKVLSVLRR